MVSVQPISQKSTSIINIQSKNHSQPDLKILSTINSDTSPKSTTEIIPYIPNIPKSMAMVPYFASFHKFIEGKSIAIVGPSNSIVGRKLGNYIDKHDLIVRLNKSLPIPKNRYIDIGSRTEIIYNSLNTTDYPGENQIHPNFFYQHGIQYLCCSYPSIYPFKNDIMKFISLNRGLIPFRYLDLELFQKLENILRTRPYTGTCAIVDLLKFNIKKLYITGLDFYATAYYSEYRKLDKSETKQKRHNNIHDAKPQIDLLRSLVLNDPRIEPDSVLDDILFHHYRSFLKKFTDKYIWNNVLQSTKGTITDSHLSRWINNYKSHIYFLNDTCTLSHWQNTFSNKSPNDIIICNLTNPHLTNTTDDTCIDLLIFNDSSIKNIPPNINIQSVLNIYPTSKNKPITITTSNITENNILQFQDSYNREMNRSIQKLDISNCSINLYIIIFLTIYFNKHIIIIDNMDFSTRRTENLLFKFLIREKLIKINKH
jgi:hypothetical protein